MVEKNAYVYLLQFNTRTNTVVECSVTTRNVGIPQKKGNAAGVAKKELLPSARTTQHKQHTAARLWP